MKATVTSEGQITIPLPIRRKLKLHTGTVLEFDEEADCLKATKAVDLHAFSDRCRPEGVVGQDNTEMDRGVAWTSRIAAAQTR